MFATPALNRFSLIAATTMGLMGVLAVQTTQRVVQPSTFLDAPWLSLVLRIVALILSFGFTGIGIATFVKMIRFFANLATQQTAMVAEFREFKEEVKEGASHAAAQLNGHATKLERHTETVAALLSEHSQDLAVIKDRLGLGPGGVERRGPERRKRPHRRSDADDVR